MGNGVGARWVYGADGVGYDLLATRQLDTYQRNGDGSAIYGFRAR
jgi:hypothetical protein